MGIMILETKVIEPNGVIQYYQYQIDTRKPRVEIKGNRYYFNKKLIKSWKEQPIK